MSEETGSEDRERSRVFSKRRYIKSPNFKERDQKVNDIRELIKKADAELSKINEEIKVTITPKPIKDKRKELSSGLEEVIKKQGELKRKRGDISSQIKAIEMSMKQKINKIQGKTSKHKFKSVGELDKRIKHLEELIDTGTLKIVEERRFVKEISSLRRMRKDYASIDAEQKLIDEDKAKIKELRKSFGEANAREEETKFEDLMKKMDELSLKTKDIKEKRDKLFSRRRELHNEKDHLYDSIRAIRKDFDDQFNKFKQDLEREKKRREEEEKEYNLTEKKEDLEKQITEIEDSSNKPANAAEMETVTNLLAHFDPSFVKPEKSLQDQNALDKLNKHHAHTKVEISAEEAALFKKEPKNPNETLSKSKKGKKHKKRASKTRVILEPTIIVDLASLGIPLPITKDDTEKTVDALRTKLDQLKNTQDEKTKENIEAGEKQIAELRKQIADIDAEIAKIKEEKKSKKVAEEEEKEEKEEEKEEEEEKEGKKEDEKADKKEEKKDEEN